MSSPMTRILLLLALVMPAAALHSRVNATELPDQLDMSAIADPGAIDNLMLDVARAGKRLVAVGAYGVILYSDDRGSSWAQASVPVQVTLTAVSFPTPQLGWAVGHDAVVLHSSDAGETWSRQLDGRQTGKLLLSHTQQRMAQLQEQDEPDLEALDMADMALVEAERELEVGPNRPLLDVWFADQNNGVAIGAFNYFFVTEDGGRTWQDRSLSLPNPESLHLYSIAAISDGVVLIVGEFGLLLRSSDGGRSWVQLDLGYEGSLFSVAGANGQAWIAGLRGNGFFSPDGGISWQAVPLETHSTLLSVDDVAAGNAIFGGLGGTLLRFDSGEGSLSEVENPSGAHIAAALLVDDGVVTASTAGVKKISVAGVPQDVTYRSGD
jgi:photosystem II stability/assembly factor-like uncharacterized protein